METSQAQSPATRTVVCLGCGCTCDDILITTRGATNHRFQNACDLGQHWLANQLIVPVSPGGCFVEGRQATFEEAVERAADVLSSAQYPVVGPLSQWPTHAQRVACAIADRVGGVVVATDPFVPSGKRRWADVVSDHGFVTATLGEVRHRADFVLIWRANPVETHPRFWERFIDPPGEFVPGGRAERTIVVVDDHPTATTNTADQWIALGTDGDEDALAVLRSRLANLPVDARTESFIEPRTGVGANVWHQLASELAAARFGIVLFDARLAGRADSLAPGFIALVRTLNDRTRCVAMPLRGKGNPVGAENVVAWQSGYVPPVDFASGRPEQQLVIDPLAFDAALLADATRLVDSAAAQLRAIPSVVLAREARSLPWQPTVAFEVVSGWFSGGSAYRMDEIPLPLPNIESGLRQQTVLQAIEERLA